MWPDKLNMEGATIYMETGNGKVMLTRKCYVQLSKRPKAWAKKVWEVWQADYPGLKMKLHFSNRNAAIMWLKIYGEHLGIYWLNDKRVCQCDGYVWFYENGKMGASAETKRTCKFATRNN